MSFISPNTASPYAYALYNNERIGSLSYAGVPMTSDGYLNFSNNGILSPSGQLLSFNNGALAPWTLGPSDGSGVYNIGGDGLNFANFDSLLSPQERINLSSLGDYHINDNVRVFEELWFSETHTAFVATQGSYDTALFATTTSTRCRSITVKRSTTTTRRRSTFRTI